MLRELQNVYDRHGEKLRFLVVGGWNTLFSVAILWVLDQLIPYDPQSILQKELVLVASWVISVTQNFFTFKLLVFRTKGNWLREYAKMYMIYAVTFVVQSVLMQLISYVFGLSVFWANLPTILVVTIMSYVGHKYFTFRESDSVFEGEGGR
ncbi:MAG: GtrA family protein [Coriobacteriia bacterium]